MNMNMRLLSRINLSAGLLFCLAPWNALALEKLTEAQMDQVTAGAVLTGIASTGVATGETTHVDTKSTVRVRSTPGAAEVGVGIGTAYASGSDEHYANVSTAFYGDGDIVAGGGTETTVSNSNFTLAIGVIAGASVKLPKK